MKRFLAILTVFILTSSSSNSWAADTVTITESSEYTAVVEVVGQVWKGKIPTKIAYPAGTYSQKLEFQIQGILPQSVLGNRATGTDVEFEIWSDAGKKIASDTVYSFDWNPVGPNTLVSMYLTESEAIGTHTMIVRTIYELSTTGLLTRYIKSEQRFTVRIVSAVKPPVVDLNSASDYSNGLGYALGTKYAFTPLSSIVVSKYEVGLLILKSPGLDFTKSSNYYDPLVFKSVNAGSFELTYDELKPTLSKYISDFSSSAFIIKIRAVSEGGVGEWGKGYYTETKDILRAEADKKILAEQAEADKKRLAEQAEADKKRRAEQAEAERIDRIARCSSTNESILSLGKLIDTYVAKYPSKTVFEGLKIEIPAPLNCINAGDVSMESTISTQESKTISLYQTLTSEMELADRPPVVTKTITCIKGKLTKQVTGASPKCPAGYKINITITCIKGKLTKQVTGASPKCPAGYKKR
jgi:hypothetical protein